jgi:hypothetical protein
MKTEEVLELIHQNGVGQNIRCSLISENHEDDEEYISTIYNYKYNKGVINIYLDELHLKEHQKNLTRYLNCELFVYKQQKDKQSTMVLEMDCKLLRIEPKHIFVRILSVKYVDDCGKEVRQQISFLVNEKKVELF